MEIIELGGRRWRILETSTLEHLIWMDRQVAESGVGALLTKPLAGSPAGAAEMAGKFAGEIWEQITKSGKAFAFLGGLLLPEEKADTNWTPEEAETTIRFLKKLTAREDHARIRSLLISMVLGFFGAARPWAGLSDIALPAPAAPDVSVH